MDQILALIITPLLISALTQYLKKEKNERTLIFDHPQAIVAILSLLFGTAFVFWQFFLPSGWREFALTAYPVFSGGAILAYRFLSPIFEDLKK